MAAGIMSWRKREEAELRAWGVPAGSTRHSCPPPQEGEPPQPGVRGGAEWEGRSWQMLLMFSSGVRLFS